MRTNLLSLLLLVLVFSCTSEEGKNVKSTQKQYFSFEVKKLLSELDYSGKDSILIPVNSDGNILDFQKDDLNDDGIYDEIVVYSSEKPKFKVVEKEFELPEIIQRTNITFYSKVNDSLIPQKKAKRIKGNDTKVTSSKFQFEGPAWENDKVGFRNYFDQRNGMDIFGKTTEAMVFDTAAQNSSYHEYHPWGMDILKVGNSFGAGAVALKINDKLYNLAEDSESGFKIIAEGPLRSVFDMYYKELTIDSNKYNVIHRVSIYAGDFCYRSQVFIDGLKGHESLVTGIVNMESDTVYEQTVNEKFVFYTYDNQAYDGEKLGMSVVADKNLVINTGELPKDGCKYSDSYFVELSAEKSPVEFAFYAGWEKSDTSFRTRKGFENKLIEDINKF